MKIELKQKIKITCSSCKKTSEYPAVFKIRYCNQCGKKFTFLSRLKYHSKVFLNHT